MASAAQCAESIAVAVRVRPLLPSEEWNSKEQCVQVVGKSIIVTKDLSPRKSVAGEPCVDEKLATDGFDHVWGPSNTQEDVFGEVSGLVDSAFSGYNSTIFAYGPSGSGKTHTMIGTESDPGVVPRSLQRIFDLASQQHDKMFVMVLSVLELYRDSFYDLLDPSHGDHGGGSARKRSAPQGGSGTTPLKKIAVSRTGSKSSLKGDYVKLQVNSPEMAMRQIHQALGRRSTEATCLNDRSSRSHAIVTLQIQRANVSPRNSGESHAMRAASGGRVGEGTSEKETERERVSGVGGATTLGCLYMVDLAGSERIKLSGVTGERLEEAKSINVSLSALGNVLKALAEGGGEKRTSVVPYRDSKLTLLLQDALGGNSKTMMVTCISGRRDLYSHSAVALQYAARAKLVTNWTSVNVDSEKTSHIEELKAQVQELRRRLTERTEEFQAVSQEEVKALEEKALQYDKLKELMSINDNERQELNAKLTHVINGSNLLQQREKEQYEHLQGELEMYCDKLMQAYSENESHRRRISALEERVHAAKQREEELERERWESVALKTRNQELERRIRELESAAQHTRSMSGTPTARPPLRAAKSYLDSPYHHRLSPVALSPQEKAELEARHPALKGRVRLTPTPAPADPTMAVADPTMEDPPPYAEATGPLRTPEQPGPHPAPFNTPLALAFATPANDPPPRGEGAQEEEKEEREEREGEGAGMEGEGDSLVVVAAEECRMAPPPPEPRPELPPDLALLDSPGEVLVRDLATGERVPARQLIQGLSSVLLKAAVHKAALEGDAREDEEDEWGDVPDEAGDVDTEGALLEDDGGEECTEGRDAARDSGVRKKTEPSALESLMPAPRRAGRSSVGVMAYAKLPRTSGEGLAMPGKENSAPNRRGSDQGKKGGRSSSEEGGESGKGFARLAGSMRSSLFKAKNSLRGLVSKS